MTAGKDTTGIKAALLKDWAVSGITIFQSGTPFSVFSRPLERGTFNGGDDFGTFTLTQQGSAASPLSTLNWTATSSTLTGGGNSG